MTNIWSKLIKFNIYILVFLIPIFFLPFSVEVFEFNKQYLLFLLVSVTFLLWLGKMIFQDKQFRFQRTPLDIFVLVFLLVMILSAVFSKDKIVSLLGFYGRFWPNLVGALSLGMFYFLITNNVINKSQIPNPNAQSNPKSQTKKLKKSPDLSLTNYGLLKIFLLSSAFAVLITYLSIFGVFQKVSGSGIEVAGFRFLQMPSFMLTRFFNPIAGSLQGFSVFLGVLLVFLSLLVACRKFSKKKEVLLSLFLLSQVILLAILDSWQSWLIIIITLGLFLAFSFWKRVFKEDVNRLTLPVLFFIVAFLFILFNPFQEFLSSENFVNNLPQEVTLSQKTSWLTSFSSFWHNPILGTGVGSFSYSFSKYKPDSFLNTQFWQIRFDRAGNHIAETLATTGILGILSYLVLIGWFLMIGVVIFRANPSLESSGKILPIFFVVVALIISQFFYYQNTSLAFIFWLFLPFAVLSFQKREKEKVWKFSDFPEVNLVFVFVFWILLIGLLSFYFFAGKFYMADVFYKKQLQVGAFGDLDYLQKAVDWAPQRTVYRIVLANMYLAQINQELLTQPFQESLVQKTSKAIDVAQEATKQSVSRVAAWEMLGVVYRDVRQIAQGAQSWAVKSFEKALALEPKNPVLLTELGKLYLADNKEEEAKELFEKAVSFRADFVDAQVQLAFLEEGEDKINEAVARLENLVINNPSSLEARFQLGRLYYNNGEYDKSIQQFQIALQIFPNHSNSLYSLGLAYEKKGQIKNALEIFERVLQLNPENEDVKRKIEALK